MRFTLLKLGSERSISAKNVGRRHVGILIAPGANEFLGFGTQLPKASGERYRKTKRDQGNPGEHRLMKPLRHRPRSSEARTRRSPVLAPVNKEPVRRNLRTGSKGIRSSRPDFRFRQARRPSAPAAINPSNAVVVGSGSGNDAGAGRTDVVCAGGLRSRGGADEGQIPETRGYEEILGSGDEAERGKPRARIRTSEAGGCHGDAIGGVRSRQNGTTPCEVVIEGLASSRSCRIENVRIDGEKRIQSIGRHADPLTEAISIM